MIIKRDIPRVIIGATGSGVGKTTIVCGILKALKNRNKKVLGFKCGPDYIDPMFHEEVMGIPSSNLDLFFCNEDTVKLLIDEKNQEAYRGQGDIGIIEGVMGYYDGIAGISSDASAYDISVKTSTPSILIVDCKGKSVSIDAEINGFVNYKKNSNIQGVILNRISQMLYKDIKKIVEDNTGVKVLGYFPQMTDINLESRHLGLVTASEVVDLKEIIEKLGELAEETIDIDGILELGEKSAILEYDEKNIESTLRRDKSHEKEKIRIAVAKDKGFSFYYDANLRLLEKLGAKLCYFSPIKDRGLPENINGIIIGGGYPELYLKDLEKNISMKEDIKIAIEKGMPCYGECGGFMYLHKWIEDENENRFEMVGAIEGGSFPTGKLSRFGYIEVTAQEDSLMCKKGDVFKAHEFHYWDSENTGKSCKAQKPMRKRNWECIISHKNLMAGYPHVHFYSNPAFAKNFMEKARDFKNELESKLNK